LLVPEEGGKPGRSVLGRKTLIVIPTAIPCSVPEGHLLLVALPP